MHGTDYIMEKLEATITSIMSEYRDTGCISINDRLINAVTSQFCSIEERFFPAEFTEEIIVKFREIDTALKEKGSYRDTIRSMNWVDANEVADKIFYLYCEVLELSAKHKDD